MHLEHKKNVNLANEKQPSEANMNKKYTKYKQESLKERTWLGFLERVWLKLRKMQRWGERKEGKSWSLFEECESCVCDRVRQRNTPRHCLDIFGSGLWYNAHPWACVYLALGLERSSHIWLGYTLKVLDIIIRILLNNL